VDHLPPQIVIGAPASVAEPGVCRRSYIGTRHKADPCRELPARPKMASVVNRGDERRCDHWPNALQLGEPTARFVCPANGSDLLIKLLEPEIEAAELVEHFAEERRCKIRQFNLRDGVACLRQETPRALRQNNTILAKKSSHVVDKGCSNTNGAITRAVKQFKIFLMLARNGVRRGSAAPYF
jgi:hypothetical protein